MELPNRRKRGRPKGPENQVQGSGTKWDNAHFVGWDGEGSTRKDGQHDYVLLKNSEGGEIVNASKGGLQTGECFSFLTDEASRVGTRATHVCFGLSYDANMILGDCPRSVVKKLWEGERVRVGRKFRVQYRPRKSLWVKDDSTGISLTVWDVFGFYQMSFVKAIVKNLGAGYPLLPLIREGKAKRGTFKASDLPFVRRYTAAELTALVDLCDALHGSLDRAGLRVRRWDGAGAVAAALLEREGVKDHITDSPTDVHEAALYAYAGGRIETLRYGLCREIVKHYDIRSAYPAEMPTIPSLVHGRWEATHRPTERFALFHVRWNLPAGDAHPLYPFPFRSHTGSIYFPRKGESWVWRPEYEAAISVPAFDRGVKLLGGLQFVPDGSDARPFKWVPGIYAERERMKKQVPPDPAEKAVKLGLNASYGKCAQHVGGIDGKPPPFHQIEYAGWITSATRAKLFLAAMQRPRAIITLATDGIYSTEALDLDCADRLGAWEFAEHERMLIAQSGVYWVVNRPKADGRCDKCRGPVRATPFESVTCANDECGWSSLVEHYRGFDEDTLDPDKVLGAWRRKETTLDASSTRFFTLGAACRSPETWLKWRRWETSTRTLDLTATGKRLDVLDPGRWTAKRGPSVGLVPTDPTDPFEDVSTPYNLEFAAERGAESESAQEQVSL